MRVNFLICCALSVLIIASGCGTSQPIRPVEKGTTDLIVSFGGPIIPLDGLAIPVPYLNAGAVYGVRENLSVFGNVHLTAALFKDVGIDGGVVTSLREEEGMMPSVTVNGRLYFFWDIVRGNSKRLFPLVTVTGHYQTGEHSCFYFGADNLFQLHQFEYFFSPLIGYQFPLTSAVNAQGEVKWLAANKDTRHGIFEGATSVSGKGGVGFFFGIQVPLR